MSRQPAARGGMSVGLPSKMVRVDEVLTEQNYALCTDTSIGNVLHVALTPRRPERIPQQGETWSIDREFGQWSFVAPLPLVIPSITGDVSASDPVLVLLIQTLADLGYIKDETEA